MQQFIAELRQTARTLATVPGFTVAVLATLAAAVALETTTLAVVNAYLVRSLPYPAAERLHRITYAAPGEREPRSLEAVDWRSLSDVFEEQIAWDLDVFYMMGGEYPERAAGAWVTPGFMRGLGVRPALGRSFRDEDFLPGAPQVALISDDLWHRRFDADPGVIGRTVRAYVSDRPQEPDAFTIVGVLPSTFWHVNAYTQVITPLRARTYPYFVRLRDGITAAHAEARLSAAVRQTSLGLPAAWQARLESVHGSYSKTVRPLLAAVTAAVSLVLLIACANVTLLMVLRGMKRRSEIAVRIALGASGRQVGRLLAGESLLLCGAAAAAGAAIAFLILRFLGPVIEQQMGRSVPGGSTALSMDGHVALAVAGLAILMTLATTLPTLLTMRRRGGVFGSMTTRSTDGPGAARTRGFLISLQIAGSFGLLAGCGLMVRTVRNLVDVRTGMTVGRLVEAGLATRAQSYTSPAASVAFHERLLAQLEHAQGVSGVALSNLSPLSSFQLQRMTSDAEPARAARAAVRSISATYFSLLDIGVIDGRGFTPVDRLGAEPVVIISESLAKSLWPTSRAVGRRLHLYDRGTGRDSTLVVRTVVGVAHDVRQSATDSLTRDAYVPLAQAPTRYASIIAAPSGPAVDWAVVLRRTVRSVDPEATVGDSRLLAASVNDQIRRPRFLASLFAAFGVFTLAIGVLGVYAVTSYGVQQREREIAVRVAVGADRRSVVSMFLRQAGAQLAVGLAVGAFAAALVGQLLAAELFGTARIDPATFIVIGTLLCLASGIAVALPAWRAGGVNPTPALRAP